MKRFTLFCLCLLLLAWTLPEPPGAWGEDNACDSRYNACRDDDIQDNPITNWYSCDDPIGNFWCRDGIVKVRYYDGLTKYNYYTKSDELAKTEMHLAMLQTIVGGGGGSTACVGSAIVNKLGTAAANNSIPGSTGYVGIKLALGSSSSITGYIWRTATAGGTSNVEFSLYSDNATGDHPGTQISNSSILVPCSSFTTTPTDSNVLGSLASTLTPVISGTYWAVIHEVGDCSLLTTLASSSGNRYCESLVGGNSWTCYGNYRSEFQVIGCQP